MSHIVKVDGIERYLSVRGHALECDQCGEQYNGGNGEDKAGPIMPDGYRESSPSLLLDHANHLGWTGIEKYRHSASTQSVAPPDLCPVCSAMKGAPYWETQIHELERTSPLAKLYYRAQGPLLQKHTIVMPLQRDDIGISTYDWPLRNRYKEPPSVIELKIIHSDGLVIRLEFDLNVRWTNRKPGWWRAKAHRVRLWSWGDGKVYAKELSPQH